MGRNSVGAGPGPLDARRYGRGSVSPRGSGCRPLARDARSRTSAWIVSSLCDGGVGAWRRSSCLRQRRIAGFEPWARRWCCLDPVARSRSPGPDRLRRGWRRAPGRAGAGAGRRRGGATRTCQVGRARASAREPCTSMAPERSSPRCQRANATVSVTVTTRSSSPPGCFSHSSPVAPLDQQPAAAPGPRQGGEVETHEDPALGKDLAVQVTPHPRPQHQPGCACSGVNSVHCNPHFWRASMTSHSSRPAWVGS